MTEGSFQSHRSGGRPTVGLVLTGGGSRAAYQVGALLRSV